VFVEFKSGQRRHMDVGDQAGGLDKTSGMRGNQAADEKKASTL